MPDISMCSGLGCNQAERCFRYLAIPDKYAQAYFADPPKTDADNCEYFMKSKHEW